MPDGTIRVGVVGVGRGQSFAYGAKAAGMELVAICDTWEERLRQVGQNLGVTTYTDYDKFLEHELDAVVLANYFHEHAPFAVKALAAGKHVMSECAACHTLAEGVALARAVEQSGRIYLFAENYPYAAANQEMRRLYREGLIGDFRYGEGEYVHPFSAREYDGISPGVNHWRNWIPATYYCTHSIGPLMYATGLRPVKVNGFVVPYDLDDPEFTNSSRRQDTVGLIILRMDNGSIVKSLHGHLRGHGSWVRMHGNHGMMEIGRFPGGHGVVAGGHLRIWREAWDKEPGEPVERVYQPDFPVHHQQAMAAGHGGGDFFTNFFFAEAIRTGQQPVIDVYAGLDMTIAGILAYRSALNDSAPMDLPDFRDEAVRKQHENDNWSADPRRAGPGQPAPSVRGEIELSPEALEIAREVWRGIGYDGE